MKIKLKYKLTLIYSFLILILILIIIFSSNQVFMSNFDDYVKHKQTEEIQNIIDQVSILFYDNKAPNYEDLYEIGIDALDKGLIITVYIDLDTQLICMSDDLSSESKEMLEHMEDTSKSSHHNSSGNYEENTYEIRKNNIYYGYITIGYYGPIYYNEFDISFFETFKTSIYKIGLIFFILSSIAVYFFASKLSNPIYRISKIATDIGNGKYNKNFELNSSITEIQDLINSISTLANNLEAQRQEKKQLSINYTHELRTPLTCVLTTIEGMQDGVFNITQERLDSLYSEILNISKMIENVDKLIETSNSKIFLNKKIFDLTNLINICIDNFESQFKSKNITLYFQNTSKEIHMINADEEKIKSVLVNLISNALKYTNNDGNVTISTEKSSDFITIKVKDTGIGIDEKDQKLIFNELYRGEKSRVKKVDGFGIGLSICKNIVLLHNGKIDVNSQLGKGSEFIVLLPLESQTTFL